MFNITWLENRISLFFAGNSRSDVVIQPRFFTSLNTWAYLRHIAAILLLPLFLLSGTANATEFLVNTTTFGTQSNSSTAALVGGGFVITWEDNSQTGADTANEAIRAQLFTATGVAQGAAVLVNTTVLSTQSAPDIAALNGGGFVIAWEDNSQTGGDTSGRAIRAQRYNAVGVRQGGEFLVNTATGGGQTDPSITGLNNGGFVIAWRDDSATGGDTSGGAVRAQRYDAAGVAQETEFLVNTTTTNFQFAPDIAALNNGGFVITWQDDSLTGGDISSRAIRAQSYDAAGAKQGAEFLVNTTTSGTQGDPSIAALNNGGFVITWRDFSKTGGDSSSNAIRAQRYDATGVAQGVEFLVNTTTSSDQISPSVTELVGGGFVISWQDSSQSSGDTSGDAIRAQRYDAMGTVNGGEFLVNATTAGSQQHPHLASLNDGGFVIAWTDNSQTGGDTSGPAIRAERYDASGAVQAAELLVNTTTISDQSEPSTAALSDGGFVVVWKSSDAGLSSFDIAGQRYDAASVAQGSQFGITLATDQLLVKVAGLSGGGFVITWQQGAVGDVLVQRYDAAGVAQGSSFVVSSTSIGSTQANPSVAALNNGGFIITWDDNSQTGNDTIGTAVRARRFSAGGIQQGTEFQVNTTEAGSQSNPSVAGLASGGFVIAWQDTSQTGGDTSGFAIRAQVYSSLGLAQGSEFLISTTVVNNQILPRVSGLVGGGFVIAWEDTSATGDDTSSSAVRAQSYTKNGVAQGTEFVVNTTTAGLQGVPSVTSLNGNGFIIAWQDSSQTSGDISNTAIRAQRYDVNGVAKGVEFLANTTTNADQSSVDMAVLNDGHFVMAWQDNSQTGADTSNRAIRANVFSAQDTLLVSSVLPAARTGFFPGGPAITVFASVINAGADTAKNCVFTVPEALPVTLKYQLTNALNVATGPGDVPFDLAVGQTRSFILAFTPTATNGGQDVFPDTACSNGNVASIPGVNTAFLTITDAPGPDILSIGATTSNDGIINVTGGAGFMTSSAINIGEGDADGSQDAAVVVTADTGSAELDVLLQWCETDSNSICINPISPVSTPINTTIGDTAKFFAVFAFDQTDGAGIPLDAANSRVFLRFRSTGGANYSVTSAAVKVVP